ncbi:MAG: YceI family protein [Bacteroidia bacterium]|nr:YceI family protein [Bacteroidia bacterium]
MKNETKWSIDPAHTEISFKVKHLMISTVSGVFREFGATVFTTSNDFTSAKIDFWMNPSSVDTNEEKRDGHLKSPDFFDAEKYKKITFVSDSFEKSGDNNLFKLGGNLTIKGITKKVMLDVEFGGIVKDPYGNEKAGFSVNGKINRKDWGLNWNALLETGGVMVSEEVRINCEVELLKQK